MSLETYRYIEGTDNRYAVSNHGLVQSSRTNTVLTGVPYRGRLRVRIAYTTGARREYVHRLVALSFLGPPPAAGMSVNHIDGDKTNNRVENLEWVTTAENNKHARDLGLNTPNHGEKNGRTRLTELDVRRILFLAGHVADSVTASCWGISVSSVRDIRTGRRWSRVYESVRAERGADRAVR